MTLADAFASIAACAAASPLRRARLVWHAQLATNRLVAEGYMTEPEAHPRAWLYETIARARRP